MCCLHRQSISFQLVLATDSKRSFLLYDYGSGVMKWEEGAKWENHSILLGYTDGSVEGMQLNVSDVYRPDRGSNIGKAFQLSHISVYLLFFSHIYPICWKKRIKIYCCLEDIQLRLLFETTVLLMHIASRSIVIQQLMPAHNG